MDDPQRKQLLERVNREGATIGHRIPEQITIQGESVALRDFVFEVRRRESYPQSERERVKRATRNLRRGRKQRLETLEEDPISYEDGEELVNEILGIDRALNALGSLEATDIEAEAEQQEVADKRRWMGFLRRALGHDDRSSGQSRGLER
ncbi:MAG: DUF5788 family protein [Salinarchaeum sp.]